jgi:hypothetical protein
MSGALHDAVASLIQQMGLEAAEQHLNTTGSPAARQEFKRQRETLLAADLSKGNTPAPVVREQLIAAGISRRTAYRRIQKAQAATAAMVHKAAREIGRQIGRDGGAAAFASLRGPTYYEHPIEEQEQQSMEPASQGAFNPPKVQTEALNRALKLLRASGCAFAVIDACGVKHGTLDVVVPKAPKPTKKPRNHPPGAYLEHHKSLTSTIQPGECRTVPFGPFSSDEDRESLRSSISAYCSREWGNGSYITAIADAGIEVLRIE